MGLKPGLCGEILGWLNTPAIATIIGCSGPLSCWKEYPLDRLRFWTKVFKFQFKISKYWLIADWIRSRFPGPFELMHYYIMTLLPLFYNGAQMFVFNSSIWFSSLFLVSVAFKEQKLSLVNKTLFNNIIGSLLYVVSSNSFRPKHTREV